MDGEDQRNRGHKSHATGAKAAKKTIVQKKKKGLDLQPNRGNNPKAFTGPSAGSFKAKSQAQSTEKREHVLHLPGMDNTLSSLLEEPPLLVAVVGPPKCGKTTLIRSMVRLYANRTLSKIHGPVTVVAGRSRRLTFLECPNNLNAMCDVAKTADVILLMVDGSYGFEMETFEFLNIAQIHGFPRIIGIVSHLDTLPDNKALKRRKKFLRHRFWHEVADGAKMLCLSPMQGNQYRGTDVLKLHQLLICVNPKIQNWRNTHSCILVDRHEDVTNPDLIAQEPNMSRTIAMYGYVRGKPLRPNQMVHIPGLGDFPVAHVSRQDDPCGFQDIKQGTSQGHKMRHLSAKQKKLYAPYCSVGGVTYDDDAVYIHEDAERQNIERSGEGFELMKSLQRVQTTVDERGNRAALATVDDGRRRPVNFTNEESLDLDIRDEDVERPSDFKAVGYTFDDEESDESDDDDDDNGALWDKLAEDGDDGLNAYGDMTSFGASKGRAAVTSDAETYGEPGETLPYLLREYELAPRLPNDIDTVKITDLHHNWKDNDLLARVKNLFVTGKWKKSEGGFGDTGAEDDDGADVGGEEEDLDKGYDSEDEEFQQLIRGEKSMKEATSLIPDADSEQDVDDDGEEGDDGELPSANKPQIGPRKSNALAAVKSDTKRTYNTGVSSNGRPNAASDDEDDDDFNILDDNEDDDTNGKGFNAFDDPELQGLVDHFVSAKAGPTSTSAIADEESFLGKQVDSGNRLGGSQLKNVKKMAGSRLGEDDNEDDDNAIAAGAELTAEQAEALKKRMAKKAAFDESYDAGPDGTKKNATTGYYRHLQDAQKQKQADIDEALKMVGEDIDRKISLVGYFSGLYVRVVLENIPVEFIRVFNPETPIVIGGLNAGEDQLQVIHAKVKRHRWFPKILKAQDPIMISMGWRRFQTQPIFAAEDPNGRHRYLKYTPLHMHCYCAFYGPVAPPNTGFIAIPVSDKRVHNFRPTCTGYTVGNDNATQVVKKLKLTGTPDKVQKTTVFVKGMFNSDIEAAKFVGAKVKAVSGLRGIIKAVIKGKNGLVRCTFEDKLLMSDMVFLRAWKPVDPPRYCAMAPNLLDPNWVGMRPMRELRRELGLKFEQKKDSEYTEVKRRRNVNDDEAVQVAISRNTRKSLPFDLKSEYISLGTADGGATAAQQRAAAATTIAPEQREMRKQALLDVFVNKANKMDSQKRASAKVKRAKTARVDEKELEEYARKLKKAKKETARKQEFRSQHKTRK